MKHFKKDRNRGHTFLALFNQVLDCPNFKKLNAAACKLLLDIATQYRGRNNGDLQATFTLMKLRGWRSSSTLASALDELLYYGFIGKSRQGGKHRCNLFYLTWQPIDDLPLKNLDVSPSNVACHSWKTERPAYRQAKKLDAREMGPIRSVIEKIGATVEHKQKN